MKLATSKRLAAQRGTTLVELSVVIAVILLLVGVLFVGITGWKNAANQSACILNISTIQKAVRSYAAANSLDTGGTCTSANLIAAGYFTTALPTCPNNSAAYTVTGTVPAVGSVYATCPNGHAPANHTNW
jgi:type II secretory pathway pseudopilin PulG